MPDYNKCCGTCEYGSYDSIQGYVCMNKESKYVADFVEYGHTCDCWEQIQKKQEHSFEDGRY